MPIIYHHRMRIIHLTKVCGFSPKVEVNNVLHSPKNHIKTNFLWPTLLYLNLQQGFGCARTPNDAQSLNMASFAAASWVCVCSGAILGRCWTPVNPWWALYRHTLLVKDKPNRRREQRHRTETTALGTWKTYYALYRERPHTHTDKVPRVRKQHQERITGVSYHSWMLCRKATKHRLSMCVWPITNSMTSRKPDCSYTDRIFTDVPFPRNANS